MSINIFQLTEREINWSNVILCCELPRNKGEFLTILKLFDDGIAQGKYIFYIHKEFQKYINLNDRSKDFY